MKQPTRNQHKVVSMISMLLQRGISPNCLLSTHETIWENFLSFHFATRRYDFAFHEVLEVLLLRGADVQQGWKLLEAFIERCGNYDDSFKRVAQTSNILFGHGFNPNQPQNNGRTP